MNQSKKPKISREQRAEFERSIQLQILEYEARYYPCGMDVPAALLARKFTADTAASSRQRSSNRER